MGPKRKERVAMPPRRKEGRATLMVGVCFVRKLSSSDGCSSVGSSSGDGCSCFLLKKCREVDVHVYNARDDGANPSV